MLRLRRRAACLAVVLTTVLAALPAPAQAASPPGELLVGFHGAIDPTLVQLLGGTVLRTFPELAIAQVHVADPDDFRRRASALPGVAFVETNDRLRPAISSWDGSTTDISSWDAYSPDAASWDISSWDISSWDISSWDISSWDISSWDISSWDISSWDISSWDISSWDWGRMDPGFPHQWGLGAAHFPDAWNVTVGTGRTTVCVLDTGIDATHPDLAPSLWRGKDGRVGYNAMRGGTSVHDDVGHGTHVAGIVGATLANGTGIAGAARVTLLPIKVMNATGGHESDLAQGLLFCAREGGRIASMSLHLDAPSPTVERALQHVRQQGVLAIASSGNGGAASVAYPAAYPGVLAVGAVKPDATVPGFSNRGDALDLVAPGYRIASTLPGGAYAMGSGTSQAAPFVAAAAALVWDVRPEWSADAVSGALTASARDFGPAGRDATYGHGALDAGAAVRRAAEAP